MSKATKSILRVDASPRGEQSVSRDLAVALTEMLKPEYVVHRDLAVATIPFVNQDWVNGAFSPADQREKQHLEALTHSDEIVEEVRNADTLIISFPIYNFGVPASVKAWFDQLARSGETFSYTEKGPVGLVHGKKAYVIVTSGGTQVDSDIDFATPWMRQALRFIGITDIEVIAADSQMVDPGRVDAARQHIERIGETHAHAAA